MIDFFVKGQELTVSQPVIVSDTLDYLEARFSFSTRDWDGLTKWAHFEKSGVVYDVILRGDKIEKAQHLNLSDGVWNVYLHGNEFVNGETVERITTQVKTIAVEKSGVLDGEPLPQIPASAAEQIVAVAENAERIAQSVRDDADAGEFKGDKGDSPVRGVDYYTEEDKTEIVDDVRAKITKSDVGLGNVDNTSDENKPISSPARAYIDGKVKEATDEVDDLADMVEAVAEAEHAIEARLNEIVPDGTSQDNPLVNEDKARNSIDVGGRAFTYNGHVFPELTVEKVIDAYNRSNTNHRAIVLNWHYGNIDLFIDVISVGNYGDEIVLEIMMYNQYKVEYIVENDTISHTVVEDYTKPSGGIPAEDMTDAVQASLAKADTALLDMPFEQIEEFTMEEAGEFSRTKEPDGTAYNFRHLYVIIENTTSSSQTVSLYVDLVKSNGSVVNLGATYTIIAPKNATYGTPAQAPFVFLLIGKMFLPFSLTTASTDSGARNYYAPRQRALLQGIDNEYIGGFGTWGTPLAAGTKIRIYGVRK